MGPLSGLRVIEMSGLGPCPLAGQLLGDLGAEVITIDRVPSPPDSTDVTRRNKRSVVLNLKKSGAADITKKLIESSDILIEGFRPGVMERLGLGPDDCRSVNERLIYGRMTGWGQSGPLSSRAGHDINYLSLTGLLHSIGGRDFPVPPLNIIGDYAGGTMFLLFGILSALYERERSGLGQTIDVAMVDCVPLLCGLIQTMQSRGQWTTDRQSNLLDGGAPFYRCYRTLDKKFVSVGSLEPQFFEELVRLSGLDSVPEQYDRSGWAELESKLKKLFLTKTRLEWEEIFGESDSCLFPVLDWSEAPTHPHNVSRGIFYESDGVTQASPAPRFGRSTLERPVLPEGIGSSTRDILDEIGYSSSEIEDFFEGGVCGE